MYCITLEGTRLDRCVSLCIVNSLKEKSRIARFGPSWILAMEKETRRITLWHMIKKGNGSDHFILHHFDQNRRKVGLVVLHRQIGKGSETLDQERWHGTDHIGTRNGAGRIRGRIIELLLLNGKESMLDKETCWIRSKKYPVASSQKEKDRINDGTTRVFLTRT